MECATGSCWDQDQIRPLVTIKWMDFLKYFCTFVIRFQIQLAVSCRLRMFS